MNKPELIERLIPRSPDLSATDIQMAVNNIFEQMTAALENGERIEVCGFGSFDILQMKTRLARNPKTEVNRGQVLSFAFC